MFRNIAILIGIAIVVGVVGVALGNRLRAAQTLPAQPIAFNHRLHLERAQGIQCEDCHQFVTSQTYAGLPSKHLCLDCHDADIDSTTSESHPDYMILKGYVESDTDIPWHRVTATPDDVFFSHRRHVTVAQLDCRECHPAMPDRTTPPTRGPVVMKMDTCLECHDQHGASVDCVACHR